MSESATWQSLQRQARAERRRDGASSAAAPSRRAPTSRHGMRGGTSRNTGASPVAVDAAGTSVGGATSSRSRRRAQPTSLGSRAQLPTHAGQPRWHRQRSTRPSAAVNTSSSRS